MDTGVLELPTIPAGVMVLLGFFAPYLIALVNSPRWTSAHKRVVSIVASIILAAIALGGYFVITGDAIPEWPMLILLFIVIAQTSYALVTKPSANKVEARAGNKPEPLA